MKVLVACEFSGRVRDAFLARGFDAWSCDLLPCDSDPGRHIQGDVLPHLERANYDLIIAHPPCTRLANSGVRWLHERDLWDDMREAAGFLLQCLNANAKHVAVENPVMHKYAVEIVGRKADFTIQPWQFGHGETKRTCFWTKNLPPLTPTNIVEGREQRIWKMPPGANRWKERSKTFQGVADAMAQQWGDYVRLG